jgi:glycosyltransferase involved in cell wall biosynthesis
MRALDIVVNASSPEPFGLVIIEAMAAGRPVVAIGGSGGPADILEDGRTGILCPDRTPEMLAVAIQSVLSNDDLRRDIGARARTVVEERFSVQHMARAFGTIAREFASVT